MSSFAYITNIRFAYRADQHTKPTQIRFIKTYFFPHYQMIIFDADFDIFRKFSTSLKTANNILWKYPGFMLLCWDYYNYITRHKAKIIKPQHATKARRGKPLPYTVYRSLNSQNMQ